MKKFILVLLMIGVLLVSVVFIAWATEEIKGEFELWHYWMAGGEVEALNALKDAFTEEYPGVIFKDRGIPGGSTELARQIGTAIMGGNPPETFMVGLGYQLKMFIDADRLLPITDVWEEINGDDIFPKGLCNVIQINGEAWSVPINIHTINHIWYNKKMFEKYDLKEPKTWEEFVQVCKIFKENGLTPLTGSGKSWGLYQLYPFIISNVGADGYVQLGKGQLSWTDPRVKKAFQMFKEYAISNLVDGWAGYGWAEAARLFVNEEVPMYNTVGDWAAGFFESQGMEPGVDFDFFPAPGTTDIVIGQVDSFALLKGSKRPDLGKLFMEFVASPKAQKAFNTYKGSMASSLKTPPDFYNPIMLRTYKRMKNPQTVFLPNLYFLTPPEFYASLGEEYYRYAINPTEDVLNSVLQKLEDLRKELEVDDRWIEWQWD